MITGFVFVMMLVIEYVNVQTRGVWRQKFFRYKWGEYIFAALLGAIPGCLGAFAVVALFSHRILSIGAVVAAMIATSGDESFVMFAMIPDKAFFLTLILFAIGIGAGGLTDLLLKKESKHSLDFCDNIQLHENDECICFPRGQIVPQWRERSPFRITLIVVLGLFVLAIATGQVGPEAWGCARGSIGGWVDTRIRTSFNLSNLIYQRHHSLQYSVSEFYRARWSWYVANACPFTSSVFYRKRNKPDCGILCGYNRSTAMVAHR